MLEWSELKPDWDGERPAKRASHLMAEHNISWLQWRRFSCLSRPLCRLSETRRLPAGLLSVVLRGPAAREATVVLGAKY
jgi:hypothetical protein